MANVKKWVGKIVSLKANIATPVDILEKCNIIRIINPKSTASTVYVALTDNVSADWWEERVPGGQQGAVIRSGPLGTVFMVAATDTTIQIHQIESDDPDFIYQVQYVSGQVTVTSTTGLKASELNLDAEKDLQVDVKTLPALPAGTNNIGDVDVLSMPDVTGGAWQKVTFAAAETKTVKAAPGRIFKIIVEGTIVVYPQDGVNQCWKSGEADFGNRGLICAVDIRLTSNGAGTAWIQYS